MGTEAAQPTLVSQVAEAADRLSDWLVNAAYPRWYEAGFDASTGTFFETIDLETGKATDTPIRGRVPARQVYCFAEAGRLGWTGPWRTVVTLGFDRYLARCRLDDASFGALLDVEGALLDRRFDLYNQAFALLAFAHVGNVLPERRAAL